jgi:hypothetical protein
VSDHNAFVDDVDARRWRDLPQSAPSHFHASEFYIGTAADVGRDICLRLMEADRRPARGDLERIWQAVAQTPVLLLAARYDTARGSVVDLVGGRRKAPDGTTQTVRPRPLIVQGVPEAEAANFCRAVLHETSSHAANRLIARWMDERATDLPGLKNDGLFARHALMNYVPDREDWPSASERARPARQHTGRDLVTALGFTIDDTTEPGASLLIVNGAPQAAALFLQGDGSFDEATAKFGAQSPVTHALAIARRHRVRWVVLTRGTSIRLHPVSPDVGVGRRGRSTTYIEINLQMLPPDAAGYLGLLFSAEALDEGGTIDEILAASERFATGLGTRLRERVYNEVVPHLATVLGGRLASTSATTDQWLAEAYRQCMFVLFRLLFVAYAEDRGLLPYGRNRPYSQASLKSLAGTLVPYAQGEEEYQSTSAVFWRRVVDLWRAVDRGKRDWAIPEYNGGLFSSATPTGATLNSLELTDAEFGPVLARLLVDVDADGVFGPVDFRSLSVREFGTIYEGLLESELSVADVDLAVDSKGLYVPAGPKSTVLVARGEVYFHNRSGARKSSGSYFTKPFAVEHLLDNALDHVIAEHLGRVQGDLERGDDASASRRFLDFRCIDIAMGSGHFLVAAVDRLEARFSEFLALHPIPGLTRELETLRAAAVQQLRHCADDALIEDSALLRRQIARRCVYGVDLNPISVELARVALWIHTFVPGLPLSFLDHNLVCGNSLTGLGTLDEALQLTQGEPTPEGQARQARIGADTIQRHLESARPSLERLGTVVEASVADIRAAKTAHDAALAAVAPASRMFDLLILDRAGLGAFAIVPATPEEVDALHASPRVVDALAALAPLHFPLAFPEAFLRDSPGFDCVVGNPPWDKVRFEPQQFWVVRAPGLRALTEPRQKQRMEQLRMERPGDALAEQREIAARERLQTLVDKSFQLQGRGQHGHHDFAKLFLERALGLLTETGTLGYVLPRTSMVLAGWTDLRRSLMKGHALLTTQARNRGGWLFEDVHQQIMVVLCSRAADGAGVTIWPASTVNDLRAANNGSAIKLTNEEIDSLTDKSVIPWFSDKAERAVFDKLRFQPRLGRGDGWITGTADSSRWDFSTAGPHSGFVGAETTDSWKVLMTRHVDAYRIALEEPFQRVVPQPARLVGLSLGVVTSPMAETVVGGTHPPIVYRYPSMNDNSRTLIATALPSKGFLYSKGYAHGVRLQGNVATVEVLALLGVMNTCACDWWVRRFVDRHVTKQIIDSLPLPNWSLEQRQRVAMYVGELLRRSGLEVMAGGRVLPETETPAGASSFELLAKIERHVWEGYGLNVDLLPIVLADFNQKGCPSELRVAIAAQFDVSAMALHEDG